LLLLISVAPAAAQVPEHFDAVADTYVSAAAGANQNHGADGALRVTVAGQRHALVAFDLDFVQTFVGDDCYFFDDIAAADLVLELTSVSGCPSGGCRLEVYTTSDFAEGNGTSGAGATWKCAADSDIANTSVDCADNWNGGVFEALVGTATVHNGQTGAVRVDVTDAVASAGAGDLQRRFIIAGDTPGEVVFASREAGQAPRIDVTNRPIPDAELAERKWVQVFDQTMSYLEAGEGPNTFLLLHGMPAYSYMFRNVVAELAPYGRVVAPDWVGIGYSDHPTRFEFDYRFQNQAAYIAELVEQLGLTAGGQKIILVLQEVGGLGGFHYATTHQQDILGIAFHDTWIDICPPELAAAGWCRTDTIAPAPYFGLWEYCVYQSFECACATVPPMFLDPSAAKYQVLRTLSDAAAATYAAPYTLDATCSDTQGVIGFPSNVPVPVPGEPAAGRQLYDTYLGVLEQWSVPKLLMYGDPGTFVAFTPGQVTYAQATYPNLSASCIGRAGHFGPEDVPFNYARRILEWAAAQGILR